MRNHLITLIVFNLLSLSAPNLWAARPVSGPVQLLFLGADPHAMKTGYVPARPDVVASLPLVFPGNSKVLDFVAPTTPGKYDVLCTFPGHWRLMRAVMIVTQN